MNKVDKIVNAMEIADLPSNYWINSCVRLPELETSKSIIQRDGQSVWEHTMLVIDLLTIKNPITLLSGLFHDLGKGYVLPIDGAPSSRFPGHDNQSANIAETRLTKWGATPYIINSVTRIISTHMFDISDAMREKTIRKFVADVGKNNIQNWFTLRIADSCSYSANKQYQNRFIETFRKAVVSYLEKQPGLDQSIFKQLKGSEGIQIEGGDS